jgi:transforming growth factor-beta-induced protein
MFRITSLFLACLAAPAFAALGTQTSRQLQGTVVDLAVATDSLSTLVAAATAADLVEVLSDDENNLTLFAPTNDAFDALPAGLLTALLTPGFKMHLEEILLYHAFPDAAVLSTALEAIQLLEMANGEFVTVTSDAGVVTVETTAGVTSTVTTADVAGSNGVVHIIDGVLVPSTIGATVIDLDDFDYSTLLSLITLADLDATLMSAGPFTLFAPDNDAFEEDISEANLAFLISEEGAEMLASILTYHVVAGSVTSDLVTDGAMVATVQGEMLEFEIDDSFVIVNDLATVIDEDILAFNGVTHGIDTVLFPFETVVELAAATAELSTLVAAASAAGLVEDLGLFEITLTVFAPTNDAFAALPAGLVDLLLTPGFKKHLTEILLYHAFEDAAVLSTDLEATQELSMINGEMVTVNKSDTGVVTVVTNGGTTATVTAADMVGSNGVVHIIDGVLVPSSIGANVIALVATQYSTLLSLITLADLDATLMSAGPFTLFAPDNAAFGRLPAETVAFLQSADGKAELIEILKYHVVALSLTSDLLISGNVNTVQGERINIEFSSASNTIMVNKAFINAKDFLLALNGVTQGIDTVLTVPLASTLEPTMAPTTSGGLALGASLSALFAAVLMTVAL